MCSPRHSQNSESAGHKGLAVFIQTVFFLPVFEILSTADSSRLQNREPSLFQTFRKECILKHQNLDMENVSKFEEFYGRVGTFEPVSVC